MAASSWNLNTLLTSLSSLSLLAGAYLLLGGDLSQAAQVAPLILGIVPALVLLAWQRPWLYLVAGILLPAFPLVVLFVFGAYNALLHPGSGTEATGMWLIFLGALLGILGGVGGFVQGRRGGHAPAGGILRARHGVVAFALVLLVLGSMATAQLAGADLRNVTERPAAHVEAEDTVRVVLTGYAFAPKEVRIPAGTLVNLQVENGDPAMHTFAYALDGVTYETPIPSGSVVTIPMKFDAPQQIHFWCSPHSGGPSDMGEDSMWGTLIVE